MIRPIDYNAVDMENMTVQPLTDELTMDDLEMAPVDKDAILEFLNRLDSSIEAPIKGTPEIREIIISNEPTKEPLTIVDKSDKFDKFVESINIRDAEKVKIDYDNRSITIWR